MKYILFGIVITITGIVLSIIEHHEVPAELNLDSLERPGISYKKFLFPYLIPIGIFVATIGFGEILSKTKKKKRNYYTMKSVL
ncbi:MAG: hypothetical protein WKF66_08940 [Pedobacter sp.]